MAPDLQKETTDAIARADEALTRFQYDAECIDEYRNILFSQLKKILDSTQFSEDNAYLPIYKEGTSIAARIVKTQVIEIHGKEYLLTKTYPVSDAMRSEVLAAYDTLKEVIKTHDRMFFADIIERVPLDKGQRIRLLQKHDEEVFHVKIESQSNNFSINKLFGGAMRQ